jgi:aerobic carbon-monoxide dehydrogenase medium subunit
MEPASFAYFAPTSLNEALDLLEQHGDDAKLIAGGHSLLPAMKLRLAEPRTLIDMTTIPGLGGIRLDGDALVIGALTVHADIASSDLVRQRMPGLADAASAIGDTQVRNRGTIGGSVAHADPGADFPVILTALNATFVLTSKQGSRTVAADDFFVDFFTTALEPLEAVTEIRVPLPPAGTGTGYAKLGNPASGYVVISAGALIGRGSDGRSTTARVAIGGLAGGPWRANATEAALIGQPLTADAIAAAAAYAAEGAELDDDLFASADYKRQLAAVYAQRAIEAAVGRVGA